MSGAISSQNAELLAAAAAAAAAVENGNNDGSRVTQDLPKEVEKVAETAEAVVVPVLEKVASKAQEEAAATEAAPEVKAEVKSEVKVDVAPAAATEVKADVKAEVAPAAATEVKADVKAEVAPAAATEVKAEVPASEAPQEGQPTGPPTGPPTGSDSTPVVASPANQNQPVVGPPTATGLSVKADVRHTLKQFKNANGEFTWSETAKDPSSSTPAEKAAKYVTVGNLSTILGIANEATRAAGLTGDCVTRLQVAGAFFKGANTAIGVADAAVKVVEAVDKGIAFAKDGTDLGKGLAFGGAAANAAASGVSAAEKLASAGIVPISSEVNSILGGIGQGLKFVGGVFNIAEASKKLADNQFVVKGEKLGEIFKIAAAVAAIFLAIVGIIALFGVVLPALLLPIAGVVVAVSALASGIVKGIVSSNKNKFVKSLLDGEPCAVAV